MAPSMTTNKEELHSAITAKAELDRTVSRLIIEDVTSVMAKNLSTLLDVMERQHSEAMDALKDGAARLGKLEARIGELEARQAAHEKSTLEDILSREKRIDLTATLEKIAPHVDTLIAIVERERRSDGD